MQMFWDKKIETLKPADLQDLQLKRLKKTLHQVQNVEFYRNRLTTAGLKNTVIKTLDDIQKIPFTKKQDLRDGYPFGFFAVPFKKDRKNSYNIRHNGETNGCRVYQKRSGYVGKPDCTQHDNDWYR